MPGKVEFPEGTVAPARASSAELQRNSPINGSNVGKPHRSSSSKSLHDSNSHKRSSPVKIIQSGRCYTLTTKQCIFFLQYFKSNSFL